MTNDLNKENKCNSLLSGGRKYDYVYILKFLAILFITNSHFKPVYPEHLNQFAFGGAMGCAIFFFVSGFTLAHSKKDNFIKWYGKRILRIYPAMWIYYMVTLKFESWTMFLWPHLWFLQAIMVFYAAYYFVSKYAYSKYLSISLILFVPLLLVYSFSDHSIWMIDYAQHPYKIHWIYYFSIMLVGAWYRLNMGKYRICLERINKWPFVSSCALLFLITYGLKLVCEKAIIDINFQLLFPLLLLISVISFLFASMKFELSENVFSKVIIWVADRTLELFIVQVLIVKEFAVIDNPILRFFSVIFAILISACILHWIVNLLVSPILKRYF